MNRSFLVLAAACLATPFAALAEEAATPRLDLSELSESWSPFLGVSAARTVEPPQPRRTLPRSGAVGFMRGPIPGDGRWGVEGGYLRTSDDDKALYIGVSADWSVVEFARGVEGRLGVFVAYAEMPGLVEGSDDLDPVTIGDFAPLAAAQASVTVGDSLSFVSRVGPAGEDGDLVVGFEAVYAF